MTHAVEPLAATRAQTHRDRRRPVQPGGRLWDEAGLITFSLTSGSAFALQTMNPTVGEVVDAHSVFRTDAVGRAVRSIGSVMTWVYGGEEALAEGDRLRAMHAGFTATDEHGVTHHALTSGPWAWIILTGGYAMTVSAQLFARRPMTRAEQEETYEELVQVMRNLHVAEKEIPPTYADFLARFEEIVANDLVPHRITYTYLETVRRVPPPPALPKMLWPLWRVLAYLPGRLQYFFTVGTLPQSAREQLGLRWTAKDERRLRRLGRVIGWVVALLPERVRYFPIAYEARRAERARRKLRSVLRRRPM